MWLFFIIDECNIVKHIEVGIAMGIGVEKPHIESVCLHHMFECLLSRLRGHIGRISYLEMTGGVDLSFLRNEVGRIDGWEL